MIQPRMHALIGLLSFLFPDFLPTLLPTSPTLCPEGLQLTKEDAPNV